MQRRALNATRQHHIRESFERFDEGGKGWLCRAELKCAIASLVGYRPPRVEVQMMLEQTDDGRVTFEQFRPAMEAKLGAVDPEDHIRRLFKAFDVRCQGFITRRDLQQVFKECLPRIPTDVVDEIFDEVDTDGDGRVSCREFCTLMRGSMGLA